MTLELTPPPRAANEPVDLAEDLRAAMREIAASVAVITAGADAWALGATITSVTSVSLSPPMLAVSLNRQLRMSRAIRDAGIFRINYLSDHHGEIARAFSRQIPAHERFGFGDWDLDAEDAPLLRSAIANVLCRLTRVVPCGSHDLLLGSVDAVRTSAGKPLLYRRGVFIPD